MKHRVTLVFLAFFFSLFLLSVATGANAQVPENSALYQTLMAKDRQLFEQGFNRCSMKDMQAVIAPELAFFHDQGGTQNRAQFFEAVHNNICNNRNGKPIRTLVPGSTQIFELRNNGVLYGAIQTGKHRFYTQGKALAETGMTEARFSHVWLLIQGQWQLQTALSYDHQHRLGNTLNPVRVLPKKKSAPKTLFDLTIASLSFRMVWQ